ncbi:MAG: nucleotidyl transferase AbiEii/AbiGii toxin family protein, partial [Candidatus Omnitrophica bacterium]|nr:nucleotidyl transferase AbiEii/AbiGii toxin family protein [Candidatus Omnitrophota bacterium]MBU1809713.1 nucleotidyl transferase AbiEii/AbiGii toxin family protein [Candidatus Omnitrophota bacterium]
ILHFAFCTEYSEKFRRGSLNIYLLWEEKIRMKNKNSYIEDEQRRITDLVTKKFKNYYLTGGTALSFYFNHRFSEDLDFFTQKYKKEDPDRIMSYVFKETSFNFKLEAEQDDPKLIPMRVYFLELNKRCVLKIDFVQDFQENIKRIKNGLHSVEDIYYRKISAAIGMIKKQDATGRVIHAGRQSVKDLFDLYYLSKHHKFFSEFLFEYFSYDRAESLIAWYRGFNRMNLKIELLDLVPNIDAGKVIKHLDSEILKRLPEKLM